MLAENVDRTKGCAWVVIQAMELFMRPLAWKDILCGLQARFQHKGGDYGDRSA